MQKTTSIQIGSIIAGFLIIIYSLGQATNYGVYAGFFIPVFFQILGLFSKWHKTRHSFLMTMPTILKR
jgi:hypothetical protein